MLITENKRLVELCAQIKRQEKIVALDTEFERITTYYPKLSLVQIALANGDSWAIDALACTDLMPLKEILEAKEIIKIAHAGMQDFEIFQNLGIEAVNIFDTQIAASFNGEEGQISYASLVKKYFGKELDKSLQFSKWMKRPLQPKQLQYALADVEYLIPLHSKMQEELRHKYSWAIAESTAQNTFPDAAIDWDNIIAKIKLRLNQEQVLIYCLLMLYRNEEGKTRNLSRRRILSDAAAMDIAKRLHITKYIQKQLSIQDISNINLILNGEHHFQMEANKLKKLLLNPSTINPVALQVVMLMLKKEAEKLRISTRLLSNKQEVQNYLLGKPSNLTTGWRKQIIGNVLKDIKNLPAWLPYEQLDKIFTILRQAQGESRLVGGCVRDIIIGKISNDFDIATTLPPEQVLLLMQQHTIKCIPTGIEFGTVTAILEGRKYEITSLREDVKCDGRHAQVIFSKDWQQDAVRRDFTINAMSLDIYSGKIYDYFAGQQDLKDKLICFVGQPAERIKEDYLRILRYFRFYAYFGGDNIHALSLAACQKHAGGLCQISGERIQKEMWRLLTAPFAKQAIELMNNANVMEHLALPKAVDLAFEKFSKQPLVNLAAILRAGRCDNKAVERLCKRWSLSNRDSKILKLLHEEQNLTIEDDQLKHQAWIFKHGKEKYCNLIELLQLEQPSALYEQRLKDGREWQIPSLPINGNDIIELGIKGKEVGLQLEHAKNSWIQSNFTLQREKLLEMITANNEKESIGN